MKLDFSGLNIALDVEKVDSIIEELVSELEQVISPENPMDQRSLFALKASKN